jgi:hypothetical protein
LEKCGSVLCEAASFRGIIKGLKRAPMIFYGALMNLRCAPRLPALVTSMLRLRLRTRPARLPSFPKVTHEF